MFAVNIGILARLCVGSKCHMTCCNSFAVLACISGHSFLECVLGGCCHCDDLICLSLEFTGGY